MMVKGVNKQIIEVKNPDSIYFEKVVFYLRSGVSVLPDEISRREIDRYIKECEPPEEKLSRRTTKILVSSAITIAIIAAIIIATLS